MEESEIERMRQDLASIKEFEPRNLFDRMNNNDDHHLTASEIQEFMANNHSNVTIEQCMDIIVEFDSNLDKTLEYDEFLNIFMPATNRQLREYSLYRRGPAYYNDLSRPLPINVSSLVLRILESEVRLSEKQIIARQELFEHPDHSAKATFDTVSKGRRDISMPDLIEFLERNGYYSTTSELEGILRRCDHDADRAFCFEEFCEITGNE